MKVNDTDLKDVMPALVLDSDHVILSFFKGVHRSLKIISDFLKGHPDMQDLSMFLQLFEKKIEIWEELTDPESADRVQVFASLALDTLKNLDRKRKVERPQNTDSDYVRDPKVHSGIMLEVNIQKLFAEKQLTKAENHNFLVGTVFVLSCFPWESARSDLESINKEITDNPFYLRWIQCPENSEAESAIAAASCDTRVNFGFWCEKTLKSAITKLGDCLFLKNSDVKNLPYDAQADIVQCLKTLSKVAMNSVSETEKVYSSLSVMNDTLRMLISKVAAHGRVGPAIRDEKGIVLVVALSTLSF